MSNVKEKIVNTLTNGWSGWIRIGILLIGFGICYASLKADIHLNKVLFEKYEKVSTKLMEKFECKLDELERKLWAYRTATRMNERG